MPLLFPEAARVMFGLSAAPEGSDYFYVSRIAASLMLGWTGLLVWGSCKPVERRAVLLLTVAPVLAGLAGATELGDGRPVLILDGKPLLVDHDARTVKARLRRTRSVTPRLERSVRTLDVTSRGTLLTLLAVRSPTVGREQDQKVGDVIAKIPQISVVTKAVSVLVLVATVAAPKKW